MKMKSFAMLIASGLLAASVAYIAPAMADDDMTGQLTADATDNSTQNNGSTDNSMNNTGSSSDSSSGSGSSSSDQGSPDTATGDDDY